MWVHVHVHVHACRLGMSVGLQLLGNWNVNQLDSPLISHLAKPMTITVRCIIQLAT